MGLKELKLFSEGQRDHLKAIENAFTALKATLKKNTDLMNTEKEAQLSEAKASFLEEKKQLEHKLF